MEVVKLYTKLLELCVKRENVAMTANFMSWANYTKI